MDKHCLGDVSPQIQPRCRTFVLCGDVALGGWGCTRVTEAWRGMSPISELFATRTIFTCSRKRRLQQRNETLQQLQSEYTDTENTSTVNNQSSQFSWLFSPVCNTISVTIKTPMKNLVAVLVLGAILHNLLQKSISTAQNLRAGVLVQTLLMHLSGHTARLPATKSACQSRINVFTKSERSGWGRTRTRQSMRSDPCHAGPAKQAPCSGI